MVVPDDIAASIDAVAKEDVLARGDRIFGSATAKRFDPDATTVFFDTGQGELMLQRSNPRQCKFRTWDVGIRDLYS